MRWELCLVVWSSHMINAIFGIELVPKTIWNLQGFEGWSSLTNRGWQGRECKHQDQDDRRVNHSSENHVRSHIFCRACCSTHGQRLIWALPPVNATLLKENFYGQLASPRDDISCAAMGCINLYVHTNIVVLYRRAEGFEVWPTHWCRPEVTHRSWLPFILYLPNLTLTYLTASQANII